MKLANVVKAMAAFHKRKPFQNYSIQLTSGEHVRITHPESVQLRSELLYFVSQQGDNHLFDAESVCQFTDAPK